MLKRTLKSNYIRIRFFILLLFSPIFIAAVTGSNGSETSSSEQINSLAENGNLLSKNNEHLNTNTTGLKGTLIKVGKMMLLLSVVISFVSAGKAFLILHDGKRAVMRLGFSLAFYFIIKIFFP